MTQPVAKRLRLEDLVHELGLGPFPSYSPSAPDAVDDGDGPYPPAWLNPNSTPYSFTVPTPGYAPGYATVTVPGSTPGYAPVPGSAPGYAPVPGSATGYTPPPGPATGYTPPPGPATGYAIVPGSAPGYTPPPGPATGHAIVPGSVPDSEIHPSAGSAPDVQFPLTKDKSKIIHIGYDMIMKSSFIMLRHHEKALLFSLEEFRTLVQDETLIKTALENKTRIAAIVVSDYKLSVCVFKNKEKQQYATLCLENKHIKIYLGLLSWLKLIQFKQDIIKSAEKIAMELS
jgi:hypothetical protein